MYIAIAVLVIIVIMFSSAIIVKFLGIGTERNINNGVIVEISSDYNYIIVRNKAEFRIVKMTTEQLKGLMVDDYVIIHSDYNIEKIGRDVNNSPYSKNEIDDDNVIL